ncbi:golgin subfamily A member 6-like protein 26 [Spea bombifrons]|uniref:golgin subfamily A member 6-like protein 26 n=1 Tax=Spea bombifrons TaxID=233779 RepID=UPI00234BD368|nr:golgin subfamily A member 6-like protein 26 [Spea bombifrons]
MNWEAKLDSILTSTDSNMAKIKERLYTRAELTRGDTHLDLPLGKISLYEDRPSKPSSPYVSPTNTFNYVSSSEDLVAISSQLLSQAKMISTLHQSIDRLERDRDQQQQRIQSLEDEVHSLRAARRDTHQYELERKMERLRQEVSSELRHLQERGRDSSAGASGSGQRSIVGVIQEVNENKRLLWKEYESMRRDTDYLNQRLRQQEEDMLQQISDSQEVKRAQDRTAKMLEEILSSQQMQRAEVSRTRSDTHGIQRDLLQIRSSIGELKEDVRILEGKVYTHSARRERTEKAKSKRSKKGTTFSSPSSSEDSASQINLADISSDDTSSSLDIPSVSRGSKGKSSSHKLGSRKKTTIFLKEGDLSDDLDGLSDSPPELSFNDL